MALTLNERHLVNNDSLSKQAGLLLHSDFQNQTILYLIILGFPAWLPGKPITFCHIKKYTFGILIGLENAVDSLTQ